LTAEQAIRAVEESGGWFELQHGESIFVRRAPKQLAPVLRTLKADILALLRQRAAQGPASGELTPAEIKELNEGYRARYDGFTPPQLPLPAVRKP
jgi:hypothetical protein